jgi:oligopeptide transport system substrate-binding protein
MERAVRRMRKLLPFVIGLVTVAAIACGEGSSPDPASPDAPASAPVSEALEAPTPSSVAEASPSAPAAPPAPAGSEAVAAADTPSGGTFRRLWADPPTLDPHLTTDTTSAGVVVEIFGGLVALSTDLQLVPDLAESWTISGDGRVYTFTLRPEAKFHDGKPVTADDFKWSINRAANPQTASPVADVYLNDIVGIEDVLEGTATDVSGVKVIDSQTLQITIDAPKAYFLAKLTYPTAYVLDRENVEAGGRAWADSPNGTGPFKLKEYRIGERIVLERNENYHRELAKIDSVVMNLAGGQSMAMYENDEIDITGVSLFDLNRVLDPSDDLNSQLVVAPPDFNISYIGFNTTMPPFDDLNFRKALNHAVDKDLIASEVLSDLVVSAYGILPPGFPAYNSEIQGLRYDPELAKQLLADSRPTTPAMEKECGCTTYADPETRPRIVVNVPGSGGTIGLDLEVVIEMWRQVLGVEVEIQQTEWATYLEDLNNEKFQTFAGLGWEADYPDPQDFLDILFHTESSINHGGYSNAEVDRILEDARVEPDATRRVDLYRQAEVMIVEDAAWVPLWYRGERHVLIKPYINDYRLTPMIIPKLRQVSIGR